MTPEVLRLAAEFKQELIAGENNAIAAIGTGYDAAIADIDATLETLLAKMIEAQESGQRVTPSWLYRQEQYRILREQVKAELDALGKTAADVTDAGARRAIGLGNTHATGLVGAALGPGAPAIAVTFGGLHTDAVIQLAAQLSRKRAPLRTVLTKYVGETAVERVKSELVTGITLGRNPRVVSRAISKRLGGLRYEMERVARTEYLRAYRAANHEVYKENSDVLAGWIWSASLDDRTCMSCWAMHGSFHEMDEVLDDHAMGRCTPIPETKTFSELGIDAPESRIEVVTGEERFKRYGPDHQRKVMGDAKYEAWKDGQFEFSDLSKRTLDPVWGSSRSEAPLKDLVA